MFNFDGGLVKPPLKFGLGDSIPYVTNNKLIIHDLNCIKHR